MSTPSSPRSRSFSSAGPRRVLAVVALAAIALVAPALAAPASAGDIAVVVNPSVKVDTLSFAELRKVLLGDRQFWSAGQPVTLIVRAPVAAERTILLEKVYQMSEEQFRRYWVGKVFRAEASAEPRVVLSTQKTVELVGAIEGAIALVAAEDIPEGLKVVKIDGHAPGDKDYPLR